MSSHITIEITPYINEKDIKKIWQEIEHRSFCSIFTSWLWIESWLLNDVSSRKFLLIAYSKEKPVGIAIWCYKMHKLSHQYWLHKSGNYLKDQPWIEYNDFLVQRDSHDQIKAKMWQAWFDFIPKNSELYVGASCEENLTIPSSLKMFSYTTWQANAYGIKRNKDEAIDDNIKKLMSSNTKRQLSRSIKFYQESYGDLTIKPACNLAMVNRHWEKASILHIERWGNKLGESGFVNPYFKNFHRNIIEKGFKQNHVEILEITAGTRSLGFFYNFIWNNTVYFYLSALHYDTHNLARPGLVGHFLLCQHYFNQGMKHYDLLGGGGYKKRFSRKHSTLRCVVFLNSGYLNNVKILLWKLKEWVKEKK